MIFNQTNLTGKTIIYIGISAAFLEVENFFSKGGKKAILFYADEKLSQQQGAKYNSFDNIIVHNKAIGGRSSDVTFHRLSLRRLSSLSQPKKLFDLFPGLNITDSLPVKTHSISKIIENETSSEDDLCLIIEAPGQEYGILEALQNEQDIHSFSNIFISCSREIFYEDSRPSSDIVTLLKDSAFDCHIFDDSDPDFPKLHAQLNIFKYSRQFVTPKIVKLENTSETLTRDLNNKNSNLLRKKKLVEKYKAKLKLQENTSKMKFVHLESEMENLHVTHEQEKELMIKDHNAALDVLKSANVEINVKHEKEKKLLIQDHNLALDALKAENENINTTHEQEKELLIKDHNAALDVLKSANIDHNVNHKQENTDALDALKAERENLSSLKAIVAEREATISWLRNDRDQKLAKLQKQINDSSVLMPRRPRVIVVASVPRSGGTWLFNALRLIIGTTGHKVIGAWYDDYIPDPQIPYHIVKLHRTDQIINKPWKTFTTNRNLPDRLSSLVRMGWINDDVRSIKAAAEGQESLYNYWNAQTDKEYAFSDILRNPNLVISDIANDLGLEITSHDVDQIKSELNNMREPIDGKPDPITLLHPNHKGKNDEEAKNRISRIENILSDKISKKD